MGVCVIYARQSFGHEQDSTSIAVLLDMYNAGHIGVIPTIF